MSDITKGLYVDYRNRSEFIKYQEKTIDDLEKEIASDSNNATAYLNRGVCYYEMGDYKRAISDYNESIRINPDCALSYSNCGVCYAIQKDYTKAVEYFKRAIELEPDNMYHQENLDECAKEMNKQ